MERISVTPETLLFNWSEYFDGDRDLFQKVLRNPGTIFVYDIDGILADTAEIVLKRFSEKFCIKTDARDIDRWNYLSEIAKTAGLSSDVITHVEDDWFNPEVLQEVKRCLYVRPVVLRTANYYGADRNFVLTSRNPDLKFSTVNWLAKEFPEIKPENILIRENGGTDLVDSAKFKVDRLRELSKKAPWVVFVDDSTDFVHAVLTDGIQNCLVINVPQGKIIPGFKHERLVVINRYPEKYQAMYPFMCAVLTAIDGRSDIDG